MAANKTFRFQTQLTAKYYSNNQCHTTFNVPDIDLFQETKINFTWLITGELRWGPQSVSSRRYKGICVNKTLGWTTSPSKVQKKQALQWNNWPNLTMKYIYS